MLRFCFFLNVGMPESDELPAPPFSERRCGVECEFEGFKSSGDGGVTMAEPKSKINHGLAETPRLRWAEGRKMSEGAWTRE